MSQNQLTRTINYYKQVTDAALKNLAQGKKFQMRKWLNNPYLVIANVQYFEEIHNSTAAKKLIKDYQDAMKKMYYEAKKQYDKALAMVNATKDPTTKQILLNRIANSGLTGFVAKDGSRWNIETYSNMYTRHLNNELYRLRELDNAAKGSGLVKISNHSTKCKICKPWEGRILTLEEYDNAKSKGFGHPNCLHLVSEVK